ncbi:MAG: aldose 1-epimerase family protein, partial [Clostridiales bacterium]|nr:aldose 1-epimerase family protein [Clostridiales bacterium]
RELFDYDVILKDNPVSKSISLESDKTDKKVTVNYPDSNCIAVWSPTGDVNATFVCLEAWSSVPTYFDDNHEDIETKDHPIKIAGGSTYKYMYEIIID